MNTCIYLLFSLMIIENVGGWPWIAALGYLPAFGNNPYFNCGGSLISHRHVLTAGHCAFERPDLFMVRLSVLNLESENYGNKPVDYGISKVVIHEEYNQTTLENDIAILKLKESVQFTDFVHTVCLPTNSEISFHITEGTLVHVAGWGMNKEGGSLSPRHLMEVALPVVSLDECKESLKILETSMIDSRNICAGYEEGGKDACQGDSGGPLVLYKNNRAYLIGIVSFGYGCAKPGYPGVYIRVAYYEEWVHDNIKKLKKN